MYIIDDILNLLEKKGLKQADLCSYIHINTSTMTNWKNRKTDPPAKYIIPICEFLDISPYRLLQGKEKISSLELTENEQRIIDIFKSLTETQQGQVIERAEMLSESNENKK